MAAAIQQRASFLGARPVVQARPVVLAKAPRTQVKAQALFGFGGGNKAAAATGTSYYICIDCGYIYDGGSEWKSVPGSYKCPACGSPKSRFKVYKGDDVRGKPNNTGAAMKKRMGAKQW